MPEAAVTISVVHRFGAPTVAGVPVSAVLPTVWLEGVGTACDEFDLTRPQVLTACWFAAAYGMDDAWEQDGWHTSGRVWRKRWGPWASEWYGLMWRRKWDGVPDPPKADQ